jgi:hypothetical protein
MFHLTLAKYRSSGGVPFWWLADETVLSFSVSTQYNRIQLHRIVLDRQKLQIMKKYCTAEARSATEDANARKNIFHLPSIWPA